MPTYVIILYLLVSFWAAVSVLMNGVRPSRSFAWIVSCFALPFIGPLLYYFFGVNRRKFRFYKLKKHLSRRLYDEKQSASEIESEWESLGSDAFDRLSKAIAKETSNPAYSGNDVTVYHTGKETYTQLFKTLLLAQNFIHIQYYILENGSVLDELVRILEKKVQEGVEVRVLYDSIGTFSFSGRLKKRLRTADINAYPTMPLRIGNFMYTLNYRNHRKIVIVDGHIGFVGGVNISDRYVNPKSDLGVWADLHLKIRGPAVDSLHRIFIKDYHFASGQGVLPSETYLPTVKEVGTVNIQIVTSGPDSKYPTVMYQYLGMIAMAKRRICIANPYFIPGSTILNALMLASLGGVQVDLLLPSISDSRIAKYSMYSNFEHLLRAEINIYLRSDFSHSKTIIIDDELVSVGSGNFDFRSFEHNFETNALIYDSEIAQGIVKEFDAIAGNIKKLEYKAYKKRAPTQKLMEGFAKLFSPLL